MISTKWKQVVEKQTKLQLHHDIQTDNGYTILLNQLQLKYIQKKNNIKKKKFNIKIWFKGWHWLKSQPIHKTVSFCSNFCRIWNYVHALKRRSNTTNEINIGTIEAKLLRIYFIDQQNLSKRKKNDSFWVLKFIQVIFICWMRSLLWMTCKKSKKNQTHTSVSHYIAINIQFFFFIESQLQVIW